MAVCYYFNFFITMGNRVSFGKRFKHKRLSKELVKTTASSGTNVKQSGAEITITTNDKEHKSLRKRTEKIGALFNTLSHGNDVMGPENIEEFCELIEVDPADIRILILSWYFNAEIMCYYTKEEFTKGMLALGCESISQLKHKMECLKDDLNDPQKFKEIYEFTFGWSRETTEKRCLDVDMSVDMLDLLLDERKYTLAGPFKKFLASPDCKLKALNKDQWFSLLEFCSVVNEELTTYDEADCWPVLFDEFVEWFKQNRTSTSFTTTLRSESEPHTVLI